MQNEGLADFEGVKFKVVGDLWSSYYDKVVGIWGGVVSII